LADTFRCRIVTPSASLLDEQIEYASVPMFDGLMGFKPGRAPLLSRLGAGELRVEYPEHRDAKTGTLIPGGERSFVVEGGFVRMSGSELTILAERAQAGEQITLSDAEVELKNAMTKKPAAKDADERAAQQDRIYREQQAARSKVHLAKSRRGI